MGPRRDPEKPIELPGGAVMSRKHRGRPGRRRGDRRAEMARIRDRIAHEHARELVAPTSSPSPSSPLGVRPRGGDLPSRDPQGGGPTYDWTGIRMELPKPMPVYVDWASRILTMNAFDAACAIECSEGRLGF